jgi:ketosteroid isomerase-like protein
MSQENVELTYRAFDAFNRRDFDAFLALMDDDVEVSSLLVALEGDYHGRAGVRRWLQHLIDAFPDWSAEPVEVRDLGNVTMGKVRYRGRGGESGAPADQVIWQVAEWRGRKIVRLSSHNSEVEALEAAGLEE